MATHSQVFSFYGYNETLYTVSNISDRNTYGDIYRCADGVCVRMEEMKPPRGACGIWISPEGKIYIGGWGPSYRDGSRWVRMNTPVKNYFDALSGAGEDRIFMANTRSQIMHFNGYRWNLVPGAEQHNGVFYNIHAGRDGFCAVGRTIRKAPFMLIGRHK